MLSKTILVMQCFLAVFCFVQSAMADTAFINEIHYDNASTDTGEGVEIAGTAGFDLSGWEIELYNGGNGQLYGSSFLLSGILADQQDGFGSLEFLHSGIQNGPDGIALVDPFGVVMQFLSYEGSFVAVDGAAAGMTSTDIGVSETTSTPDGFSLQLTGHGADYNDFIWTGPVLNTFGAINSGQTFSAVPLPSALMLFSPCLVSIMALRRKKKR